MLPENCLLVFVIVKDDILDFRCKSSADFYS